MRRPRRRRSHRTTAGRGAARDDCLRRHSGFTALAQRLDAEELRAVIDPIVTALSDIGQRDGHVERFAGDALGSSAPVAHDDDAERALAAARDASRVDRLRSTMPKRRPT
jgi:class 3 adenylate cyclase